MLSEFPQRQTLKQILDLLVFKYKVQAVPLKVFPETPVGYWKSEGNKHKECIKINETKG